MLSASVMQMEAFWHNVATYVINLCVVFSLNEFILVNTVRRWRAYTKRNMQPAQ